MACGLYPYPKDWKLDVVKKESCEFCLEDLNERMEDAKVAEEKAKCQN